jgi:methylphosphotriester-DNA--protein-cysteine methyltransferase
MIDRRGFLVYAASGLAAGIAACGGRFRHAVKEQKGTLIASRSGERYHRLSCKQAARIVPDHALYYENAADARADGFTPCSLCRPDEASPPSTQ